MARLFTGFGARYLVLIATTCLPFAAGAAEPKWSEAPYNFVVVDQNVRDTLMEFGRNNDIPVKLSARVKGRVRGKLPSMTPREFLDRVAADHGLTWYYDGAILHVSAEAESATDIVRPTSMDLASGTRKLEAMGLLDDRFSFRPAPDGSSVTISGPPAYRAAVQNVLTTATAATEPKVRVFRGGKA
jgi:type III secretion protein C